MGATRGGALLGMSAFRIRHDDSFIARSSQLQENPLSLRAWELIADLLIQLIAYFLQCRPARILDRIHARALTFIQIPAAVRTETFTIIAADCLQRQRQQYLLAQRVLE